MGSSHTLKKKTRPKFPPILHSIHHAPLSRILAQYGAQGIGVYTAIIERLFWAEDNRLEEADFKQLAHLLHLRLPRFKDIVSALVTEEILTVENSTYFSQTLCLCLASYLETAKINSENAKKRWNRKISKEISIVEMRSHSIGTTIAIPSQSEGSTMSQCDHIYSYIDNNKITTDLISLDQKLEVRSEGECEGKPIPTYDAPVELPNGKKLYAEHVALTDYELELAKGEFARAKLAPFFRRAILHVDKHLSLPENAHKRRFAYKHLITWGLEAALKEQKARLETKITMERASSKTSQNNSLSGAFRRSKDLPIASERVMSLVEQVLPQKGGK